MHKWPARVFINRMLALLRTNPHKKRITFDQDFFQDLNWLLTFLPRLNGFTCFQKTVIPEDHTLNVDASLTDFGGVWSNRVYVSPIVQLTQLKIVHLEMLNILVALRIWKEFWRHSTVKIFCDNKAVVQVSECLAESSTSISTFNHFISSEAFQDFYILHHVYGTSSVCKPS